MDKVALKRLSMEVITDGLRRHGQQDLRIEVSSSELLPYAESFLQFVVEYIQQSGRKISSGETFPYGYWLVKFNLNGNVLDVWEHDAEATGFIPGGSLTLAYWRDQHQVCDQLKAPFVAPRADQLTVIDEGVLQGRPGEGVRYPSPEHMSGWWITSDRYDGDVKTLRTEHTYHITSARPELARYLALPYGFRFDLYSAEPAIRFDEQVANEPAV